MAAIAKVIVDEGKAVPEIQPYAPRSDLDWEDGGEIQVDPAEIAEAHWYRFDQLPQLSPRVSVSRLLIDATVKRMREIYGS